MPQSSDAAAQPSPPQALLRMVTGPWVAQAIYAAAKLGIADLLRDGPQPCAGLAQATRSDTRSLYRVLRALASQGVFAEEGERDFRLTPLAECLRSDVPGSLRAFAIMMGEQWVWRSWGEILHSVRTGQPAFEHVFGQPLFDYYATHPEAGRVSSEGLTSRSAPENGAVVAAYDFSSARTLVDVGGGQGSLLAAILAANPDLRGVLFDMPHVIEMTRPILGELVHAGRCELQAGDFFSALPEGGDIYVMKKVIHDWDDEHARTILRSCRAAIPDTGRLLLVELVVPLGNEPSFSKLLDLLMMVYPGGMERTEPEHRSLLGSAGFELLRIIPTASTVSIIEAVPR
jgi:hypothetical protein